MARHETPLTAQAVLRFMQADPTENGVLLDVTGLGTAALHLANPYHSGESIATSRRVVTQLKARGLVEAHFTKSGREGIKLTDHGWNSDPETALQAVQPSEPAPPASTVVVLGSNTGTIASASPHAQQSVAIGAVDVRGITQALKDIGVPNDEVESLRVAVESDGPARREPGPQCRTWLQRAGGAIASGAWSLARGATIATIREAIVSRLSGAAS